MFTYIDKKCKQRWSDPRLYIKDGQGSTSSHYSEMRSNEHLDVLVPEITEAIVEKCVICLFSLVIF